MRSDIDTETPADTETIAPSAAPRFRATGRRLARRLAVLTSTLAIAAVAVPAAASAEGLANTTRTSSGASLSSSGYCGGSTFNYTVDAGGFEYLRLTEVTATTTTSGEWTAVNQVARFTYQLPYSVQYKSYVVEGYDWNPATSSWSYAQVVTSFLQVPALDYSTWYC